MKINGQEIKGLNTIDLVLPRTNSDNIVFHFEALQDLSGILNYMTLPIPKKRLGKGNVTTEDLNDPTYVEQVRVFNERQNHWFILESLKPTDIEWDTVVMEDPSTWGNYITELADAGISATEMKLIYAAIDEVNSLDEAKMEAARELFQNEGR